MHIAFSTINHTNVPLLIAKIVSLEFQNIPTCFVNNKILTNTNFKQSLFFTSYTANQENLTVIVSLQSTRIAKF